MEYWKELATLAGGVIVMWRLISMGRSVVTKGELKDHCATQMKLIQSQIKVAVLEAMNEWLKQNGRRLKE